MKPLLHRKTLWAFVGAALPVVALLADELQDEPTIPAWARLAAKLVALACTGYGVHRLSLDGKGSKP